jgi:regulator of replication initiation timing
MKIKKDSIERIQTQIDMIRHESRTLSYRIERMIEQRKGLQCEKKKLKELLLTLNV